MTNKRKDRYWDSAAQRWIYPPSSDEWLPIDTAPKDGTWILGKDTDVIYPCAFNPEDGLWYAPVDFSLHAGVLPSEWMPLLQALYSKPTDTR